MDKVIAGFVLGLVSMIAFMVSGTVKVCTPEIREFCKQHSQASEEKRE